MNISIIIPTYNEEEVITGLIAHLQKQTKGIFFEIIVVDGGSEDNTLNEAKKAGAVCIVSPQKGRAVQMNMGAEYASGDILYFVHADSTPPETFADDIKKAVGEGYKAGCYRFKFNSKRLLLKINAWCTRFNRLMCRGGDQTLFITCAFFDRLGGFREDFVIMEDFEIIERIQKQASFKIIPADVIVSSRKYEKNGYLRVQLANFIVFMMYFCRCSQKTLLKTYKRLIYHARF